MQELRRWTSRDKQLANDFEVTMECGKTNIGKARVLLRLAINGKALSKYLQYLLSDKVIMEECYDDHSLLRNNEVSSALLLILQMLENIQFSLWIKDKELNDLLYYSNILNKNK